MPNARNQSFVAVPETKNARDTVSVIQLHHNTPDDIVQAGTQTAACNDCGGRFRWIKIDFLTRPGHFEVKRTQSAFEGVTDAFHRVVMYYPVFVSPKFLRSDMSMPQWRQELAFP